LDIGLDARLAANDPERKCHGCFLRPGVGQGAWKRWCVRRRRWGGGDGDSTGGDEGAGIVCGENLVGGCRIMGVLVGNIPCHTNTRGAGLYEVAGRARTKEH
jgi:hypothetical protein